MREKKKENARRDLRIKVKMNRRTENEGKKLTSERNVMRVASKETAKAESRCTVHVAENVVELRLCPYSDRYSLFPRLSCAGTMLLDHVDVD